jgi:glycerate kinase
MPRILVAPDKFKGSLSASEAADAMAEGARAEGAEVELCPLSDGGEGFLDVAQRSTGASLRRARVTGPAGAPIDVPWLLADDATAFIESAAVVGLALVRDVPGGRGPSAWTTFGLGELVLHAIDQGARRVVVGLGGSATTDGGIGMAQALGVPFGGGREHLTGADLADLGPSDPAARDPRLRGVELLAVTDVDNPLTGPTGSAGVYGPQKGASAAEIARLDEGLAHLAVLCGDPGTHAGDGAAGGLGFGMRVFAGARVVGGSEWALDALRFDARLTGCDLVLTGEGRLDAQSARGKVIAGVARRAQARGIPVIAIAGKVDLDAEERRALGLADAVALVGADVPEALALARAASLVTKAAARAVRDWRTRHASV